MLLATTNRESIVIPALATIAGQPSLQNMTFPSNAFGQWKVKDPHRLMHTFTLLLKWLFLKILNDAHTPRVWMICRRRRKQSSATKQHQGRINSTSAKDGGTAPASPDRDVSCRSVGSVVVVQFSAVFYP